MFGGPVMSQFVNVNSAVAVLWVAPAAGLKRFCVARRRSRPGLRRSVYSHSMVPGGFEVTS